MICVKIVHSLCPHCGEVAPHKVVREQGARPLLWCDICRRVTVSDGMTLEVDPLPFAPGLQVAVAELDADHEHVIEILNDLHAAAKRDDEPLVAKLFARLSRDLHDHFAREEALLAAWRFPGLDEHRATHGALARELDGFLDALANGPRNGAPDVVLGIKFCLIEHLSEDAKYKDHLAAAMAAEA